MDFTNTLWLDAYINDLGKQGSDRRSSIERSWDGYSAPVSQALGFDEAVRDDIRRRQRMAEAMYEI